MGITTISLIMQKIKRHRHASITVDQRRTCGQV